MKEDASNSIKTHLPLHLLIGQHVQLLPIDFLLVEYILVVHVLDIWRLFDAVGFKEFDVGNLECLADGLGYQLSLWRGNFSL